MQIDIITPEMLEKALTARLAPLERKLATLERIMPSWLTTKQACQFLRVSKPTLLKIRDTPGSLIEVKHEGEKAGTVLYCAKSLVAHSESKTIRPRN